MSADPAKLSPQEDRVFALTAAGLSMKQIAGRMGVGVGSVAVFSHRLKKKLRVASAIQIALLWHGCDTQEALAFGDSLAAQTPSSQEPLNV